VKEIPTMFRGPRPASQPRTLRSIAEDKGTVPNGFVDGGVTAESGLPTSMPGAGQMYVEALPGVRPHTPPPGPLPFGTIRRF